MVIIGIYDKLYDVSLFLDKHPGGKSILEYYNGFECGEIFNEIGHSCGAKSMLKKYETDKKIKLKNIDNNNEYFPNLKYDKITLKLLKKRLNTTEDKFNIHKICGIITLLNIVIRTPLILFGISTIQNYNIINMISIVSILLLLLSSLNFHIPNKSNVGHEFYEYSELRLHSIIFSLRFIFIILINWLNFEDKFNRLIIFTLLHKSADYITNKYKYIGNGTAIRGNKTDYNIHIKFSHRIASVGQFISIICILDLVSDNSKTILNYNYDDIKYDTLFHGLSSILLNIFMMTLQKKSLLSRKNRSIIYLTHIWFIIIFMTPILDNEYYIYILISIIGRFGLNINKYVLYNSLYLINNYGIINYYYDKKIFNKLLLSSGISIVKTIYL